MRGVLGGILRKEREGRSASDMTRNLLERHRGRIERWEALCEELGEQPADVGIAWLLHQPAVTAPILGPRTLDQLKGGLRAPEIRLDDDVLKRIDDIFPGPGAPAPKAYAW